MLYVPTINSPCPKNDILCSKKHNNEKFPQFRRIRHILAEAVADTEFSQAQSANQDNNFSYLAQACQKLQDSKINDNGLNQGSISCDSEEDGENTDDESRPALAMQALAVALGPGDFKEYTCRVSSFLRARLTRTEFENFACQMLTHHTVILHNEFIFATLRLAMAQDQEEKRSLDTSTKNHNEDPTRCSASNLNLRKSYINKNKRSVTLTHEMRRAKLRREALLLPRLARNRVRLEVKKLNRRNPLNILSAAQFQGPFNPGAVSSIQPDYIRLLSTSTCRSVGELPSPESLRGRMTCIAYEKGLSGITGQASDLLALGLQSHLKRILLYILRTRGNKIAVSSNFVLVTPCILPLSEQTTLIDSKEKTHYNEDIEIKIDDSEEIGLIKQKDNSNLSSNISSKDIKKTKKTIFKSRKRTFSLLKDTSINQSFLAKIMSQEFQQKNNCNLKYLRQGKQFSRLENFNQFEINEKTGCSLDQNTNLCEFSDDCEDDEVDTEDENIENIQSFEGIGIIRNDFKEMINDDHAKYSNGLRLCKPHKCKKNGQSDDDDGDDSDCPNNRIKLIELAEAIWMRPTLFDDSNFIADRIIARLRHSPTPIVLYEPKNKISKDTSTRKTTL